MTPTPDWLKEIAEAGRDYSEEAIARSRVVSPLTIGGKELIPVMESEDVPYLGATNYGVIRLKPSLKEDKKRELVQHERAHIILGHPQEAHHPVEWLTHEVEANLYTYRKTGKPKRLLPQLRHWFGVMVDDAGMSGEEALDVLSRVFRRRRGIPRQWGDDLREVKKELGEVKSGTAKWE